MQQWQINIQKRRERREARRAKPDVGAWLNKAQMLHNELSLERLRAQNMQNALDPRHRGLLGQQAVINQGLGQLSNLSGCQHSQMAWPSNINNV